MEERADKKLPRPDSCSPVSGAPEGELSTRIREMTGDTSLLELKEVVAIFRTLLWEHIACLDRIHEKSDSGSDDEYRDALEKYGKRIQSIAGDIVSAVDRLSRIDERQRRMLTPEEVKKLIRKLAARVIRAVETWEEGEPRSKLVRQLAEAFGSLQIGDGR